MLSNTARDLLVGLEHAASHVQVMCWRHHTQVAMHSQRHHELSFNSKDWHGSLCAGYNGTEHTHTKWAVHIPSAHRHSVCAKCTQAQCVCQVHAGTVCVPSARRHSVCAKCTQTQCVCQVHAGTMHVPSAHRHSVGVLGHSALRPDTLHTCI